MDEDPDHYCGIKDADTADNLDIFVEKHLPSSNSNGNGIVTSPSERSGHIDLSNQMAEENVQNGEEQKEKEKYWLMHYEEYDEIDKTNVR